jgi:hypothetical protein
MLDDRVREFWRAFVAATGIDGEYTAWAFGSDATGLGLLVRDGPKRAGTSLLSEYDDGQGRCRKRAISASSLTGTAILCA